MSELLSTLGLPVLGLLFGLGLLLAALEVLRRSHRATRISDRLFAEADEGEGHASAVDPGTESSAAPPWTRRPLARWLVRAGHRAPSAERNFVLALLGCVILAMLFVWGLRASGIVDAVAGLLGGLPVVGIGLAGVVGAIPWFAGLALAGLPIWLVQRDRAQRIEGIEQDLPLVLELLATLAEAGLGFESAVGELLRAQPDGRPLSDELRLYRLEVSTGARRAEALRRLALRVDLPPVSSFTSALVHGEETGASIAGLLRPQASLVRQRRRERALATAEALPEKLVVPLLIGFLPGLLIWTLGPAFFQLFEMIDAAFG